MSDPAPLIEVERVILVSKAHTNLQRRRIILRVDRPFNGDGLFTRSTPNIHFFRAAAGGFELQFNTVDNVFTSQQLFIGVELFADATSPSTRIDDIELRLSLAVDGNVGLTDTQKLTAVELTLDICSSRTSRPADPAPLSVADKISVGRFLHIQDPGDNAGRALMIVRQPRPNTFRGNLVLNGIGPRLRLFGAADERAAAGQAVLNAVGNRHEIPAATAIPAGGLKFWLEGSGISGGLRDSGFKLGIKDLDDDGDRVMATVVRLKNLVVDIPSTPAQTARMGNSPVARHTHNHATGAVVAAPEHSEDFTVNDPLVLLRNTVLAANRINLTVTVEPAGVPVLWSVQRDTATGTGDHARVIAVSPNPKPTLVRNVGAPLTATLLTDAVGSFHIRPFVDGNGNGDYEHNIDREPSLVLNVVMVNATLHRDNSSRHNNFADTPLPNNGIRVSSGAFSLAAPATAAIHMNSQVNLIGGGADGRRGLGEVFAGWVNTISANPTTVGTYLDSGVAPPMNRIVPLVFATNTPATQIFLPPPPPPPPPPPGPAIAPPPILDTGRTPTPNGGNEATLTSSRIRVPRTNLPVGQRIIVEAVDSPAIPMFGLHPGFATANLIQFNLGLIFTGFLCLWTNHKPSITATGDPSDRLYGVLRQVDWSLSGRWNINPATGARTIATAPRSRITGRRTFSPLAPAAGTVEVRPPTALRIIGFDART